MIRQICSHCARLVELPESAAGTSVACPLCSQSIVVPPSYTPGVAPGGGLTNSPPPPPVPPVPTPPPGLNPSVLNPPSVSLPVEQDYQKPCCSIVLKPSWLDWVPVACLSLAFVMTFFAWIGSYPGGTRVYSQSPWYALVGSIDISPLPETLLEDEKEIEKHIHGNRWLIVFLPVLLITLAFAVIERVIRTQPNSINIPGPLAWLPSVWPMRFVILLGLCAILFGVLTIQTWRGYGLENAVKAKIDEQFKEKTANADSTPKKQILTIEKGRELAKYELDGTIARCLAHWAMFIAFLAMIVRLWLHRRGDKPHPRVVFEC